MIFSGFLKPKPPPVPTTKLKQIEAPKMTSPIPVPATATPVPATHKSVFAWASVGHFFATMARDIHVAEQWMEKQTPVVQAGIDTATTVVSIADPKLSSLAELIDRASKAVLGDALAVATNADSATQANGANVILDAATIASLKQLAADMQAATKQAIPAGIPVTTAVK